MRSIYGIYKLFRNVNRKKISDEAPNWFHVVTEDKEKYWDEKTIKNEETLSILSRFHKWITVTPKGKDRKRPLEKMKNNNMEETSKIMPNWMQIKHQLEGNKEDTMMSALYNNDVIYI
jgi:hypothetical protein